MAQDIENLIKERILILDGAMGTMIQQSNLTAHDFGGPALEGCNENLNVTRPDLIRAIHEAYFEAGADIVETNSFGSTPLVLAEYDLAHRAFEISRLSAVLAREAADKFATADRPRFVAGSMGPTTKSLSVTGGATFDELVESYAVQAEGLVVGGADFLMVETSQDLLNVKACGIAIQRVSEKLSRRIPIMVSGTIEAMGTTLAGQSIEAFYLSVEHLRPFAVGMNCATGPELMRDHVRALSSLAECAVSCHPNAGLPDEEGCYLETPYAFAKKMSDFAREGWLNIAGGCCGTTPEHIRELAKQIAGLPPRAYAPLHPHAVSGMEAMLLTDDMRPVLVGERTNVIGSRKFRRLIASGDFDAAAEVARTQVRAGAQVVDVCLADPDRDELSDMGQLLPLAVRKIKVPIMIDSTDPAVVEASLKQIQGKSIINSTNLEDGESRLATYANLARTYGAALVVGTIDEEGMAVSRDRKVEIALRIVKLLTEKHGLRKSDILIDPLTFPVGTGDEKYIGSARETVEAIRILRERLPECPTILGISNVSFGLPPAGREVLNAVFLYHCTKAGLSYAIVNSERLERYASIPEEERALSDRLLFTTTDELVAEFTAHYRERRVTSVIAVSDLPLEARLARYVVEGTKDGLIADLDEALTTAKPLDIINGPLMDGMSEVGRLFNNNELIVAEVLQSAEVMKAAVAYLEPHMERADSHAKGRLILATVKGDVHDIGKNLVEIILSNNGFDVVNLGIKVAPEQLIQAVREYQPDMIGLSGLLVKSAQQMVTTAEDFRHAGIDLPMLVGGAALTKKFTLTKIADKYDGPVIYAKDAMEGLDFANQLMADHSRAQLLARNQAERDGFVEQSKVHEVAPVKTSVRPRSEISREAPVFSPPDLERHVLRDYPVKLIRPYLNLQMLLGKHLGLAGNVEKRLAEGDKQAVELLDMVELLIEEAVEKRWLRANAVYQFFPSAADGDDLVIYRADGAAERARIPFPRQGKAPYLCVADFVRPVESDRHDYMAMFALTTGSQVREEAERLKAAGEYLRAHALQAIALEMAEAFAERVHQMLRDMWGFPDPLAMTMRERFIARYQGIRVSFGYPACPDLDQQATLFSLLRPEDIGLTLTDGFMMDPEASVSALAFSHPEAKYFNVEAV
ncbi:methionine synthase [Alicyclobacillus fastidiosus]|uniref:Methionine synthase n=2 Tax=Alicyclobacillus fastidiosus TaxID=392011 RepID=A0ABY6ZD47_9BACL|nr:methionine synthase [Alicyclobacillus fastidiosus]WAH40094.1 methionine synthase [Alicyclobacillus fastidiosus]GMA61419.1 methionine synthase [Alicyclobacillus fastidiosus]